MGKAKRKQQRQNSDNLDTSMTSEDEASPSKISRKHSSFGLSKTDGHDQKFATPNSLDNVCDMITNRPSSENQKKELQYLETESPEQDHIIKNSGKKSRKQRLSSEDVSNQKSNETTAKNNENKNFLSIVRQKSKKTRKDSTESAPPPSETSGEDAMPADKPTSAMSKKSQMDDRPISNPNSPAPSILSNSTPIRNNDDFAIPSSVMGTPFRSMTPLHVPKMLSPLPMTPYRSRDSERSFSEDTSLPSMSPLPKYLSPLPSTPYRSLGSERFIADNDLVDMTDSEISDMDQTPIRRNVNAMDMPNFNSPAKTNPKPTYSKDLSKLSTTPSSPENSPSSRNVKMLLKRNQANKEWNVENDNQNHSPKSFKGSPPTKMGRFAEKEDVVLPDRPVTTGKQPMKLDKVVLNLKKSAGNTWNIAEKKSANDNNAEQDNHLQTSFVQPKEERRGRKSKSVPMKIQNADEIQIENDTARIRTTTVTVSGAIPEVRSETESSPLVEDHDKLSSQAKITTVINKPPSTPTSSQRILTEKSEKQRKKMESSRRCEPIQELGIQKQPATTTTTTPVESQRPIKLSTGVAVRKTFQRKRLPTSTIQRNRNLLGNSRTTKQFQECQLPDDWKQIAELSSKASVAFNKDQEFSEVSQLMKVATGAETNIDLGFIQKVQQKLSLKNVSKVTFFVGQDKANIDLPTDDTSMVLSDPYACTEIRLDERSDGIDGTFLKLKEAEPMLHVEPKKRGRPKSQKVVPERPPASVPPISPPPSMVPMHQPIDYLPRQQPLPILANTCGFPAFNTIEDFLSNPIAILNFVS